MNARTTRWVSRFSAPISLGLLGLIILASGCDRSDTDSHAKQSSGPLRVVVDNYPLAYFTERIGGPDVEVLYLVAPGRDPAYFKPNQEQIESIQKADLVVLNGADYSKWPTKVSLSPAKTIDTSKGFKDKLITIEDAVVHSHGPEGEHSHAGLASYTWLDPDLASIQAETIENALKERLPERAVDLSTRGQDLRKDLAGIRDRLLQIVTDKEKPLLVSHPVYDYLARAAGWNIRSLHWEPDEMPSDEGWKELEALRENHPAQWLIWEGQPIDEIVQRLNGMGINSVVWDCIPGKPPEGDYLTILNENLARIERIYAGAPDGP